MTVEEAAQILYDLKNSQNDNDFPSQPLNLSMNLDTLQDSNQMTFDFLSCKCCPMPKIDFIKSKLRKESNKENYLDSFNSDVLDLSARTTGYGFGQSAIVKGMFFFVYVKFLVL